MDASTCNLQFKNAGISVWKVKRGSHRQNEGFHTKGLGLCGGVSISREQMDFKLYQASKSKSL